MHTLMDEKRRVGVTKIVESQLRQAVRLADHLEAAQDVPLLERRSGMGRKHQTVFLPRLAGKLPHLSHGPNLGFEKIRNKAGVDCPAAPLRFRRPELEARNILALLPPRLGEHLVYGETSDRQVQIRQAEPVQFFRPQARRKRQRVERFVPITGYGCEEGSRLLGIQESDLCSAGLDCTLAFSNPEPRPSRVSIEKLPFQGKLERTAQYRLSIFDGSITKTPAPETLHPFIDMDRPQFGEHNAADQWNHVRLDVIAVVLPGSERNAALSLVEL